MKYKFEIDNEGYIVGFEQSDEGVEIDLSTVDCFYIDCYKIINNKAVLDVNKYNSQISIPTWQETMDAQVTYTAMMTDTILEE